MLSYVLVYPRRSIRSSWRFNRRIYGLLVKWWSCITNRSRDRCHQYVVTMNSNIIEIKTNHCVEPVRIFIDDELIIYDKITLLVMWKQLFKHCIKYGQPRNFIFFKIIILFKNESYSSEIRTTRTSNNQ